MNIEEIVKDYKKHGKDYLKEGELFEITMKQVLKIIFDNWSKTSNNDDNDKRWWITLGMIQEELKLYDNINVYVVKNANIREIKKYDSSFEGIGFFYNNLDDFELSVMGNDINRMFYKSCLKCIGELNKFYDYVFLIGLKTSNTQITLKDWVGLCYGFNKMLDFMDCDTLDKEDILQLEFDNKIVNVKELKIMNNDVLICKNEYMECINLLRFHIYDKNIAFIVYGKKKVMGYYPYKNLFIDLNLKLLSLPSYLKDNNYAIFKIECKESDLNVSINEEDDNIENINKIYDIESDNSIKDGIFLNKKRERNDEDEED